MNSSFLKISSKEVKTNLLNLKQLVFEVTDICNLKCKYCGYGDLYEGYDPRRNNNLSIKKACNILEYLAGLWEENIDKSSNQPFTLGFFGGEPLIGMKFIKEVVQYAESLRIKGKKIYYNITTNGVLLDKYMDYLADKEFRLLISLDGDEKDNSHRVDHGNNNSHKKVFQNTKLIQRKYPNYFNRHVRFNTVLHNRNSVKSAYDFILTHFGKETSISQLNNSGIRKENVKEYLSMFKYVNDSLEKDGNLESLEDKLFMGLPNLSQLSSFIYTHSGNKFDNQRSLLYDRDKIESIPTGTCTPFSKKMFITASGKILPCETVNHEFAMGQVHENKVEINLDNIAEMYNRYAFKFIEQCKTCAFGRTCTQCIFRFDDLQNPKNKCHHYAGNRAFNDYVKKKLDYLGNNPTLYKKILHNVRIEN